MKTDRFPFYELSGTAAEIGRQYGEQARASIHSALDGLRDRLAIRSGIAPDEIKRRLGICAEDYARYAPHVLTEIEAIANAAGIEADDALLCRTRWDVGLGEDVGCTSFVVEPKRAADGRLLCGQNKDVNPSRIGSVVIVRVRRTGKPAFIAYSYVGMVEGPGFNDAGLCRFENTIHVDGRSRADPVHLLKRLLSECVDIDECIDVVRRLQGDGVLGIAAGMVLGDHSGRAVSLEIVPGDFRVVPADHGIAARANNILAPDLEPLDRVADRPEWKDSFARTSRIREVLSAGYDVTLERCQDALADHEGRPCSICRHGEKAATVAGIICVPEDSAFYATRGNPCCNPWIRYG